MKDPKQPRVGASPEEALRVRRGDSDAGLLAPPLRRGRHVLLERAARPFAGVILHLPHDLLPRADVGNARERAHAMDRAERGVAPSPPAPGPRAHPLELVAPAAERP